MTIKAPFQPQYGATQTLAVTATSQAVTYPAGNKTLVISNVGTQTVWVRSTPTGDTSAATTADMPILAGQQRGLTVNMDYTRLAAIAAATGSTIYVTPGEGFLT